MAGAIFSQVWWLSIIWIKYPQPWLGCGSLWFLGASIEWCWHVLTLSGQHWPYGTEMSRGLASTTDCQQNRRRDFAIGGNWKSSCWDFMNLHVEEVQQALSRQTFKEDCLKDMLAPITHHRPHIHHLTRASQPVIRRQNLSSAWSCIMASSILFCHLWKVTLLRFEYVLIGWRLTVLHWGTVSLCASFHLFTPDIWVIMSVGRRCCCYQGKKSRKTS